ncbi:MAG: ATP-binding cassette domain-containing protein [Clostridiales bacterium]|jgi:cell division transport system ATP-binding protein|nr:ATP-binding cassette domain-containing protein [Clostridiales bacterium]
MIEFVNCSKVYEDNGAVGFKDVSLRIGEGEFVFVVGPSGSGKSSVIRVILKEEELTGGRLIIDEEDATALGRAEIPYLRRKMGVVFQDFRLRQNKTVFENVAFAMQIVGASYREIRRNVPMALTMVGLSRKSKAYPNQLSGGEQQRTALARAIVNRPPILICDEPTGNLDPETAWEIMSLLDDINRRGTTVVVATHAWDIVDGMKKRVIALKNGAVVRDAARGGYSEQLW